MENKVYTAIGLMSGTSLDGIDVALVRTDGMDYTQLIDFETFPYDETTKTAIRGVFGRRHADEQTAAAEKMLTEVHIKAVKSFGYMADIVGFHGQTILHDPSQKFTWQIGDSALLAQETAMDVIGDFRQADIKAGGQGAPLLPICHRAFAIGIEKPFAVLNLGGVGNITWLGEDHSDILAFDTGPGNALIDDLVKAKSGQDFDRDGWLARTGKVNQGMLDEWLGHEYFKKDVPKSLDRDEWDVKSVYDLELKDGVATLSEFTVQSVLKSLEYLPGKPRALCVAGGGRHNSFIMERLRKELDYDVHPVEALGWNGDMLEAQGFAYMAVRSLLGLAITLPTTTGVPEPMTGGALYKTSKDNYKKQLSK